MAVDRISGAPNPAPDAAVRNDLLRDALDQWQVEDGTISEEELNEAARKLGVTRSKRDR